MSTVKRGSAVGVWWGIAPLLLITELRTTAPDERRLSGSYWRPTLAIHFTWKPLLPEIEDALAPFDAARTGAGQHHGCRPPRQRPPTSRRLACPLRAAGLCWRVLKWLPRRGVRETR